MTVILGNPPAETRWDDGRAVGWDDAEHEAVDALAAAGLVPPLRLVPTLPERRQGIA